MLAKCVLEGVSPSLCRAPSARVRRCRALRRVALVSCVLLVRGRTESRRRAGARVGDMVGGGLVLLCGCRNGGLCVGRMRDCVQGVGKR